MKNWKHAPYNDRYLLDAETGRTIAVFGSPEDARAVIASRDALAWYAGSHRPEDRLSDNGERAQLVLKGLA